LHLEVVIDAEIEKAEFLDLFPPYEEALEIQRIYLRLMASPVCHV
jgi:hypothetical protein